MPADLHRIVQRTLAPILRGDSRSQAPIYLVSAAGHPNFGDEFIARSWLDWLGAHFPHREVWLDCLEPGRAAHLFRDTHPRLKTTNTLWQTAHTDPPGDVALAAERMERLVTGLGSPRTDFGLRDLREMASLHLLGGGYLNTIWPENLAIVAALTAVKRHYGKPIFATGQGLLPHRLDSHEWMREQLAQFDVVESRDAEGAQQFGVEAGTDDAFLAFVNPRRIYTDDGIPLPEVMTLVQGDMYAHDREEALRADVRGFVEGSTDATTVGFVEAIPPDDARFAADYVDAGATFYPFMRSWDEGFPARSGQTWLTSRFHAHLLAAAAGARGVVLNARPGYYDIKHRLLLDLGTGWRMWDPSEGRPPVPADATGDPAFPAKARALGAQKELVARRLYPGR
ncbi:polysaccharide pyruvyl transferase family protein [Microbacterium neungamense]|uniref:polysaccharide pyruvyl transferase family protein n=1 Tax=Microbacterium neungamense TaxID=2810535 RepID=UPI00217DA592|nr:polysaccharide pyruvyl transferase family protein [Microbacterium neungamense]UWF78191.1 polysaccharide pyruvyl transferase family protein [Microbacterium neungamense]